jgi:hypothetical protein
MDRIFLILGHTGEYEDYAQWVVCAYNNIIKTKLHVKRLNDLAVKLKIHSENYNISKILDKDVKLKIDIMRKLDSHIHSIDFNGVYYSFVEIDLFKKVPKVNDEDGVESEVINLNEDQ